MSKKKRRAKLNRSKARQARKEQAKARNVGRVVTVAILGVLGYFVYGDLKAESLEGVQAPYPDTEYMGYLHEIDLIKEKLGIYKLEYDLEHDPDYQDMPKQITVCWNASQQRLVPAYQECK